MRISHLSNHLHPTVRLLQITDTHLFANQDEDLLGVQTAKSFQAVVAEITSKNMQFDAILATGDISQDHSIQSYQHFADVLSHWSQPCYWLPGNHDHQEQMAQILAQSTLARFDQVLLGTHWQLIMLDSQVKGKPYGWLDENQLKILDKALSHYPERHALIALHHHPMPSGSAWLDQHQLHNQDAFWRCLAQHQQVKGVICGHIHQSLDTYHQGCRVLATPSTCIQFLPQSEQFSLDSSYPGWREIHLHVNGEITSQVSRLTDSNFLPNMNSLGYT